MKKFWIAAALFLVSISLAAHPGIGIVKDSRGNIYYTDLKQVWKIAADGTKTVAVSGVHTHELYLDEQDNLYGEHLWYNGESKNTWGHYAWCLKHNGELVKEISPTEGFLTNYSFVRDSSGNMYWVERFTTSRIMKKTKSGEITKVIEGKFGFIGWLFSTKNGTLYFTENNTLRRVSPGNKAGSYRLETLVENIGSKSTAFTVMGRNYNSYGIWPDASGNIYLAMIDSKKVIRVDRSGKLQTVLSSSAMWTICSGLVDDDGNMWVLENSATNEVRARKISNQELATGRFENGFNREPHLVIIIFTGIAIFVLWLIIKLYLNKRKNKQIYFAA